ncbi:MAG TPA: SPOR domain-containing protein [Kangiella sp.]
MDEKLKYRLVGASVILALAVFFLPMILDSEKYRSQIQSQIPEVPSESQSQQPDESPAFQANGPVEKGPLVINLDDTEQAKQDVPNTVTTTDRKEPTQPAEDQLASQQPVEKVEQNKAENEKEQEVGAKPVEKQEAEKVARVEPNPKVENESKPKVESQPQIQPKESTESELAFSDSAWLIQIGSFSNKDNATKLVNNLRDQGYRAYQRVGDSYARVYVGPYPVKGEAEQRTGDLEKVVGSKVKVIEFDPKQH